MLIPVKSSAGTNLIPVESKLFEKRIIFLEGEINQESASEFLKQLMQLTLDDPNEKIKVFINSNGGGIDPGMTIYDAIYGSSVPIELYNIGRAYSMAAVILLSGQHGRYILPNAKVMLHEPLIHSCPGGNASSMKSLSDSLQEERRKLNAIIAKHTGMSIRQVNKATSYDHFFTAQEAIEANLCDAIVSMKELLQEA